MPPTRKTRHAPPAPAVSWRDSFTFDHVKVLIVCRGPIRMEAIEVFERLGTQPCGILLSEKDSVVYLRGLAPELRHIGRNERVHRIPDYMGATAEAKAQTIARIIHIAQEHGYTHVFAGYGFMAEDHEFIAAIEAAGLSFVGPASSVVRKAGAKDAAKALARELNVSVTPGVDNIAALTLLAGAGAGDAETHLAELVRRHTLRPPAGWERAPLPERAEHVIAAGLARGVELVTIPALQAEAERQIRALLAGHPGQRLRLKHIGGGGGKGQRIVTTPEAVAAAVAEVLAESKATGPGDNKNFLIELNIEQTRHNEIQLLGNGQWCIALGGRDCSLQMHEQKLVEVSITEAELTATAEAYRLAGKTSQAEVLRADAQVLRAMEAEAERFGEAVGLNSASTFECIVEGALHFFMEVNTRIQVEHRVTEMVYTLRFANPEEPEDTFDVASLVEAMLWVAVHGAALPRPQRVPRHPCGVEVRINATNDALRPHAGGLVLNWSPPIEHEIRDDQGICVPNPDTRQFMPYNVAGAYDSNAALLVTYGGSRAETFARMAEIIRRMQIRGEDVLTNAAFHYGLLHWMMGADPMVKPSTQFVQMYLAAVGVLKQASGELDLELAWRVFHQRAAAQGHQAAQAMEAKTTLLQRPMRRLLSRAHLLAGWLAPRPVRRFVMEGGRVAWRQNPLQVLEQLYLYLRLEPKAGASPQEQVWEHDHALLSRGLEFYADLARRLGGARPWIELEELLAQPDPPKGFDGPTWAQVRAAHRGHQLGLDYLKLPVLCGEDAGFFDLLVDEHLEPTVPEAFRSREAIARAAVVLAPPPPVSSNQILAWTGGTFYGRPSPDAPPYVAEGNHFEAGEVVGLLEVMKMFNPVRVNFSGTIVRNLVHGEAGVIVSAGQPLFEVQPDVPPEDEDGEALRVRRQHNTLALLDRC